MATRYVYRPYHPWRHGYRREKWKRRIFLAVKVLFILEVLAAAGFYIREHAVVRTTEKKVAEFPADGEEEVYGIGIGTGDGSLFWFHSRTELQDTQNLDSGKE